LCAELAHLDSMIQQMYHREARGVFGCSACAYKSTNQTVMREHIESRHVLTPGFACPHCAHVCPTRKALKMHIFRAKHLLQ
jgi:Pyruvate/2-oxoacid:ferredoxin oxidoreductase delta subunit